MGAHHAREWPSSEHAIEFAYDLLTNYGRSSRTTDLVDTTRTIVVPIVNPDGFNLSREARHAGLSASFGLFDYEMKRKNCRVSTCDAGAVRDRHLRGQRRRAPAWHRPQPQLRRPVGRRRCERELVGRHVPRRRAVLGAGGPEHPRAARRRDRSRTSSRTTRSRTSCCARRASPTWAPRSTSRVLKALGARMASHNGYANIPSYGLYDTTGGTEDWTFWTAGSLGYTFEIGPTGSTRRTTTASSTSTSAAASRRRRQGRQPRGVLRDARGDEAGGPPLGHRGLGPGRLDAARSPRRSPPRPRRSGRTTSDR